jgi:hypothetical protein
MFPNCCRLEAAYRATDYIVRGGPVIRIGERARLPRPAAFVTACNPFGRAISSFQNVTAIRRLRACVGSARAAVGTGQDGAWPPEPSLLLTGISRRVAAGLGRRLRQNAVVYIPRGRAAELLKLR